MEAAGAATQLPGARTIALVVVVLEALAAFSGTVVFVSHDRYFIDRLATRVLEVENGTVTSHEGNYEDFLRWKEAQSSGTGIKESAPSIVQTVSPRNGTSASEVSSKANIASNTIVIEGGPDPEPKEKTRRLNPIKQKQMEERCAFLEEEVPRVESALAHTEEQLGAYVSAAETQRLSTLAEDLRAQLGNLTAEWEDLMLQLEGA